MVPPCPTPSWHWSGLTGRNTARRAGREAACRYCLNICAANKRSQSTYMRRRQAPGLTNAESLTVGRERDDASTSGG